MSEFLSKDPQKALDEVKERLYNRLVAARIVSKRYDEMTAADDFVNGVFEGASNASKDEIEFLQKVLDQIEKS